MEHDDPVRIDLCVYGGGKKIKKPSCYQMEPTYPTDLYVPTQYPTDGHYVVINHLFNDMTVWKVVILKDGIVGRLGLKGCFGWFTCAREF